MPNDDDQDMSQDMSLGEAAQHLDDWLAGREVPGRKIKTSVQIAAHVLRDAATPTVPVTPSYQYEPPTSVVGGPKGSDE